MVNTKLFIGREKDLKVYNGEAVLDWAIHFFDVDLCDGEEIDFTFPDFAGAYLRVFNERLGRELKDLALTRDGAYLIANFSVADMTFEDNGNYYYEIVYLRGVYEQVLSYGKFIVI